MDKHDLKKICRATDALHAARIALEDVGKLDYLNPATVAETTHLLRVLWYDLVQARNTIVENARITKIRAITTRP